MREGYTIPHYFSYTFIVFSHTYYVKVIQVRAGHINKSIHHIKVGIQFSLMKNTILLLTLLINSAALANLEAATFRNGLLIDPATNSLFVKGLQRQF